MAILLCPTPHIVQWQTRHKCSPFPSKHSRRLHLTPLNSTSSLNRELDPLSDLQPITPTNWSFQQRMEEALDILEIMESQGMIPDPNLFCILIRSCADEQNLEFGKTVHSKIIGTKHERDAYVVNNLITMYAKCGRLDTARKLFDKMPNRNAVSWTTVISMYSQSGFPEKALKLYKLMKLESKIKPTVFTYTKALNLCAKLRNLMTGLEIHEDIVEDKCESDEFIVTALIDMYSKCGRIDSARKVFDKVAEPTISACTAMIDGYNNNSQPKEAISLLRKVLRIGFDTRKVKELGFTCMIRSCILAGALRQGQEIHAHMIKFGYDIEAGNTLNSLIQLYTKCDKMVLARGLFNKLSVKTVSLLGQMISGYVRNGVHQEGYELYVEMVHDSVVPNLFVLSWALKASLGMGMYDLKLGKEIHGRAIKSGYRLDESLVATVDTL